MNIGRRTLLKVLGLTAAGSALPGCEREVHNLVPYLLPDEAIIPGVANFYASTCRECEAGCGILVRVMEGRAKKIEGNPSHPLNEGKLCARGQAGLQNLYNPDRIQGPLKREGKRGEGKFRSISWEEGIAEWVEQFQTHAGGSALITRSVTGTLASLLTTVMDAISGRLVMYESLGEQTIRAANTLSFGTQALPHYDLANADYLLSFGTPFLEHWLSPVSLGVAYGKFRQGRPTIRGRFIQVEPRLSLTAANADRWIPIRPGTEGLLAMGIGQVLLKEGWTRLPTGEQSSFQSIFSSVSLDQISNTTEVPHQTIALLAKNLADAHAPLIMGGGPAAAHSNGTESLAIINVLNVLMGNIGQRGGLMWTEPPEVSVHTVSPERAGEQMLMALAEEFAQGSRALLHLNQVNPLFSLPPALNFARVYEHAQYIVSFSPFLDESTVMADLILPDHSQLESWGDHIQDEIIPVPAWNLSQPVVRPLYNTRAIGDVWLEAARQLGGSLGEQLPWQSFQEMVKHRWKELLIGPGGPGDSTASFETVWIQALQQGGWWPSHVETRHISPEKFSVVYKAPEFFGDPSDFPYLCYPYPSLALYDGRGANLPWLQELPDPLTTGMWGTWIELNPSTARKLGIHQGDLVRITSNYGSIEASAVYFPGLDPELIAIPIGQGHEAYGRYAEGRGANPLVLLGPNFDDRSGSLATGGTRIRVERIKGRSQLPMLDQSGQNPVAHHIQLTGGL